MQSIAPAICRRGLRGGPWLIKCQDLVSHDMTHLTSMQTGLPLVGAAPEAAAEDIEGLDHWPEAGSEPRDTIIGSSGGG